MGWVHAADTSDAFLSVGFMECNLLEGISCCHETFSVISDLITPVVKIVSIPIKMDVTLSRIWGSIN